jgi:hypothetical protein
MKKVYKPKMSDFPIPTTRIHKTKKKKSRQQEKIELKKDLTID